MKIAITVIVIGAFVLGAMYDDMKDVSDVIANILQRSNGGG